MDTSTIFKTLDRTNVVIVKQPFQYFEKDKKGNVTKQRTVQYVDNLNSIFLDEQVKIIPNPKITPIYFNKGLLKIENDKKNLIELLKIHPDNEANGGHLFRLYDVEKDELLELENYKISDKAKQLITISEKESQSSYNQKVKGVAMWLLGNNYISKTITKTILALRQRIDADVDFAKQVINYFEEKNQNEKNAVILSIIHDVIDVRDGSKIYWHNSDELIYKGTTPKDVNEEFAVWLKTKSEGRAVLKLITEKLESLI